MKVKRKLRHMRSESGDGGRALPWLVIREDGDGHRYRVGGYATRTEAQLVADRLAGGDGRARQAGKGHGRYLVEPLERASGEYA